jgi:nicotinate phosphoribosyltransferase
VRHRDEHGVAISEEIYSGPPNVAPSDRLLLTPLVQGGKITGRESLDTARERHRQVLAELPPQAFQLSRGDPAIPTVFEPDGD